MHMYGVILIVTSVMRLVNYRYVVRRPALMWPDEATDQARLGFLIGAAPIFIYALAIAFAEVAPTLSITLFFTAPILYFLLITVLRARARTQDEADQFS
jgi:hypothetical protein